MAKIKFNVKGVESGGNRKLMKNGVYEAEIVSADMGNGGKNNQDRIELNAKVVGGEYDGQYLRTDYINVESEEAAWKMRQFLEGVGLVKDGKETGTLDTEKLKGKKITVRVKGRNSEEYGIQNDIAQYISPGDDDEDLTDDDATDDDAVAAEADDATDDDAGDDELWTEDELSELDDDDLILYAFGGEDSDGDEIDGLIDGDEDDVSNYQTKKKKGKKTVTVLDRAKLIAAMLEAQGDGSGDDDDDDDDTPDYDSMEEEELKALCKTRGLSTKGKKDVLVKRLRKDDEPF